MHFLFPFPLKSSLCLSLLFVCLIDCDVCVSTGNVSIILFDHT